jgi:exopolyphosphatase/pppGpp-phosphohydrolase
MAKAIAKASGVPVDILSEEEEGRLSFIGATKTLGHPVEGKIGVVDVGGGSTEVILGTARGGWRGGRRSDRGCRTPRSRPPPGRSRGGWRP